MNTTATAAGLRMAIVLALCASAAPLLAQTQRSGGGGGSDGQKMMLQYQQLAAEKTALQSQAAQMKKDLDAAKTELTAVKKERDALKSQVGSAAAARAQSVAAKQATEKSLDQYKQRMTELVARFKETATSLKDVETERTRLQNDLKERSGAYDKCAEDNLGLFDINDDLLNRYEHVGVFTKVSASEPFTKITRTRIENLVDEYRARALELRVKKQAAP